MSKRLTERLSACLRARPTVALATAVAALAAGAAFVTARPTAAVAATGGFDFTRAQVAATGLQTPWGLTFLPDGSALVSERDTANIMQVRPGSSPVRVATVPNVSPGGEAGLLGIAVSPTYAEDQWVYAYFTAASDNRLVRFRLNAPQTQQVLLSGVPKAQFHDGGRIAFGPDGMLYLSTGDAGTSANAQNLNSLGGKILRMRPDGSVPPDNPYGSRVYSYGHRNVQGLAWDEGGRLYASEFGQNTWDELNYIVPGGNYGWPTCEGVCTDSRFRNPIVTWSTSEASPSGLAYANGTLFAGALAGKRLWTVPVSGGSRTGNPVVEFQGTYGRLRAVAVGPDGWLWVGTSNRDGRGTPAANDDRILRVPPAGGSSPSPSPSPSASPSRSPSASPSPSVSPSVSPSASPSAGPRACSATYRIVNQWQGGFQGELAVRNSGTAAITSWTVTFAFPDGQRVTQSWSGRFTQSGAAVTVANETYNGTLAPNASTTAGFNASWSGANRVPSPISCTAG
ncbi:PQQ-dependent sugar dehydrogenase [Microbispora sp. H10670]|uniref:PQQ-dependent sugar dehydrogenase n=1 Tax=Microbispora sp. H10670 TaxID=2729108 RepID=UPI0015FF3182|nr:PQQ-dependent sugar dehydrogenase [Microbispora sp. H10670]